ncbi:MAG: L-lysine 6-transaminase [Bacteroidota bacterium]
MSATAVTNKEPNVSSNGKKVPFTPVSITPSEVHQTLSRHMLADGFDMVIDLKKSQGCRIYDSRHGKKFLDFFSFFGSSALGMNHPKLATPEFMEKLAYVALNKPSNSDVYSVEMAEFVETFYRIAQPEYLPYVFFIDGGALANENAMKTAFDWKVRKNFAKGYTNERGYQVIHFRHSFHGRSGYTMSLTNTDPTKTKYFPKFKWPRIHNPAIKFPLNDEHLKQVIEEEKTAITQIKEAIINNPDDIAALIIEPIQAEGGDNHFRKEFLQELRTICDESEILLIFDEVQSGVGLTGKMWAHEWFVKPDLMSFGKKTHICGFMAGNRIDDILENVFKKPSRINSTFGGNLVDMVRAKRIFEIIHEDNLVENSRVQGEFLVGQLNDLAQEFPDLVSNPRGRGLMSAFDLDTAQNRNQLIAKAYEEGLILIGCGDRSIRFRPPLTITQDELSEGLGIIKNALKELSVGEI